MEITPEFVAAAEQLAGLSFTAAERELMLKTLQTQFEAFQKIRDVQLENSVPPALFFDPTLGGELPIVPPGPGEAPQPNTTVGDVSNDTNELAFAPLTDLSAYVQNRQISSVELELYLGRLERYDPQLRCVVTLLADKAREAARRADAELAAGRSRGPLHGIPWGAKDLLAARGAPTTWGAGPFRDQVFDEDAAVVKRLEDAGAVLLAKLTLGELAWGDVWYDATTRNPWNLEQGASGSSAGSAAATAAGLVGFAIGSETWGSIVSPGTRCGVSGLRPTFGQIKRDGAMALSWSMDKLGPMARTVADCALIYAAISASPFRWNQALDLRDVRIGYVASAFDEERDDRANDDATLETLRQLGANLVPIELPPYPVDALSFILSVEAAAAFDELTRSDRDDLLVRQGEDAWPNTLRAARLIPAVEYVQANRVRTLIMRKMAETMQTVDLYIAPSFCSNLLLTNLTGHPAVVVPNGFDKEGSPTSITFTGRLNDEATLLAAAHVYQQATDFHTQHPPLFAT